MANPSGPSDQTSQVGVSAGTTRQGAPQTTTAVSAGSSTGAASDLGQKRQAVEGEARGAAEQVKQKAGDAVEDVKREARGAAEHAKHKARATAATQKDAAAERMDGFAHALNTASDDLRERGQEFAAEYVHKAAGGLEHASEVMRERDVDQLLGTVEDFARRQPVAFLGAAVAAGFGLARLMKSSADRRHTTTSGSAPHDGGIA